MTDLIYVYGIVPADTAAPPAELRGLEGGPIDLLPAGEVAAIVGRVPAETYSDDALNGRLEDLEWVGERGLAHERVLDWFAEHAPVIPLSLFSLHRDEVRARERIGSEAGALRRVLDRLRGKREWGVKLWRREEIAREGVDSLSPSLKQLAVEIEAAAPGKRFLLERKREAARDEELRTVSKRIAHEMLERLREAATDAVAIPIPPPVAGAERTLLLHSAFLLADEAFTGFRDAVSGQAARLVGTGFEIEFTGPWPAYHFATPDDE